MQRYFNLALDFAEEDEKRYMWIIKKRLRGGGL